VHPLPRFGLAYTNRSTGILRNAPRSTDSLHTPPFLGVKQA
jgi:hypothetical protein